MSKQTSSLIPASGPTAITRWAKKSAVHKRSVYPLVGVLDLTVRSAHRVQITSMAAALTYRTIFSLIPVLVISLAFLGGLAKPTEVAAVVSRLISYTGLSEIVVSEDADTAAGGMQDERDFFFEPPSATEQTEQSTKADRPKEPEAFDTDERWVGTSPEKAGATAAPEPKPMTAAERQAHAERLDEWIAGLVERVRSIPFATIGVIGVLTLIYAAVSMLVEVEGAFNQIYRAPGGRSWTRRVMQYWTMLTLGTFLLVASFYVGERLTTLIDDLWPETLVEGLRSGVMTALPFAVTVFISTTLLVIVFTTVPHTRVEYAPALLAAFLAAIAWESGKWGFTTYIAFSTSYSRLYGSIAILPLFLLWVYVTWIIVLTGLQLAHAVQTFSQAKALAQVGNEQAIRSLVSFLGPDRYTPPEPVIVDPAAAVLVMSVVGGNFRVGRSTTADDAGAPTGLDARVVADMLERLCSAKLLHPVDTAEEGRAFALARPPETIQLAEVLNVGQTMSPPPRTAEHSRVLQELIAARMKLLEGRTLADVLPVSGGQGAGAGPGAGADTGASEGARRGQAESRERSGSASVAGESQDRAISPASGSLSSNTPRESSREGGGGRERLAEDGDPDGQDRLAAHDAAGGHGQHDGRGGAGHGGHGDEPAGTRIESVPTAEAHANGVAKLARVKQEEKDPDV
ncbi:MAG: YihY/virulence factor BrkB family protein [Planctomycetota bacterium]|nr:YihY/virulence factor BrkB family protein [Planctomycetota bacterium]